MSLVGETIEASRARCPIVSNSVMTGWQQNRWLASPPLPPSSTKKRFLEDATRPSCQCKQGETCLCQQNQDIKFIFFVAINNCTLPKAAFLVGDLMTAGVHISLTNLLFLPAKYFYRLLPSFFAFASKEMCNLLKSFWWISHRPEADKLIWSAQVIEASISRKVDLSGLLTFIISAVWE